jgi:hypothetical protein
MNVKWIFYIIEHTRCYFNMRLNRKKREYERKFSIRWRRRSKKHKKVLKREKSMYCCCNYCLLTITGWVRETCFPRPFRYTKKEKSSILKQAIQALNRASKQKNESIKNIEEWIIWIPFISFFTILLDILNLLLVIYIRT